MSTLNTVEELIEELRCGRMVIVMDDEARENEGDLLMAAEMVRPDDPRAGPTRALRSLLRRLHAHQPGLGRLYRANLTQLRAIYHVNVRAFLRAILQYTDIVRDPNLYDFPVDGRTRRLFSQYLFSFKLNPRTVLFLGYFDNWSGNQAIDVRQVNRTLFLKLGYGTWLM